MSMDLTQICIAPELCVAIGGAEYRFSEFRMEHRARLQAYIRKVVPDPWEHAVSRTRDLPDGVRAPLLEAARKESLRWPPDVTSPEGMAVLLETNETNQIEVLREGLSIHQPGTTAEAAERVYRAMRREPDADRLVRRVFRVLFGQPPDRGEVPLPKG